MALIGWVAVCPNQVLASSIVVPDEAPTVQIGIDSGADTVLIREGTYPERPVVDRAVVLQGTGTSSRPRLDGLRIHNLNFWTVPPLLSVSRIAFSDRVEHTTVSYRPRLLQLSFSECSLDSGLVQTLSTDPEDVSLIAIRNCVLGGQSRARVNQVYMDADTIDGGVAWQVHEAWIQHSWFRGGPGRAIELNDVPRPGITAHNRIEGYTTGISVDDGDPYMIKNNTIERCGTGIQLRSGVYLEVEGNVILDCGVGVDADGVDGLSLRGNTIIRSGQGVRTAYVGGLLAERNVIGECRGPGMILEAPLPAGALPDPLAAVLRSNTLFHNDGSGVVVSASLGYPIVVEQNIGFANREWGLSVPSGQQVDLGCNDWFECGLGPVSGVAGDPTDLNVDPLFCNIDNADVALDAGSPLLVIEGCRDIGARGAACGVTPVLVQLFTADRVSGAVKVVWQVIQNTLPSHVWIERREEPSGPWIRPTTETSMDNGATVELDWGASPDSTYSYRLIALQGSDAVVIGSPIVVEGQGGRGWRLLDVGPNPGSGATAMAFSLRLTGPVAIDLLDMQGRRVASLVRGVWSSGAHVVDWNGDLRNGERAPAGVYVLRYLHPEGHDQRRLVRLR